MTEAVTPGQVLQSAVASLEGVDLAAAADLARKLNKLLQGTRMDTAVVATALLALNVARVALAQAAPDGVPTPRPELFVAAVVEQLALGVDLAEEIERLGGSRDMGRA